MVLLRLSRQSLKALAYYLNTNIKICHLKREITPNDVFTHLINIILLWPLSISCHFRIKTLFYYKQRDVPNFFLNHFYMMCVILNGPQPNSALLQLIQWACFLESIQAKATRIPAKVQLSILYNTHLQTCKTLASAPPCFCLSPIQITASWRESRLVKALQPVSEPRRLFKPLDQRTTLGHFDRGSNAS